MEEGLGACVLLRSIRFRFLKSMVKHLDPQTISQTTERHARTLTLAEVDGLRVGGEGRNGQKRGAKAKKDKLASRNGVNIHTTSPTVTFVAFRVENFRVSSCG